MSGDIPKRSKGPLSKSGRSVIPARGFESHYLRSLIGNKYSHDREYKNVATGKSVVISILMRVRQLLFTEFLQKFWKRQLFL